MPFKIYMAFILLVFTVSPVWAYNEEKLDKLGNLNSAYSLREQHSTFHYDLVKLLAIKAGFPADSAELIARYSALVDQINPKPGYPYSISPTSIPDTFLTWSESLAGTERTASGINQFGENAGVYWHFALRNPVDTATTGGMVYAIDFPHPVPASYRGPNNFWRVPFSYYLDSIYNWAIHGTGVPGNPNGAPRNVYYFNTLSNQYELVPTASIISLGILLHSIGDSYSHEECSVTDTVRSHPESPLLCNGIYHHLEMPYNNPNYSYPHIDKCAQAIWRALRAYATQRGYSYTTLWVDSNGNNIPDELEETGDPSHTATFIERWKDAETRDLNNDGVVDHFDHSARRIGLAANEILTGTGEEFLDITPLDVFPNPASGKIYVRVYEVKTEQEIVLRDVTGRKVMQQSIAGSGTRTEMNVSSLADGIYIISAGNAVRKIIITGN